MRLRCSSLQSCSRERLAEELTRPVLLCRIAWPLLTFTPVDPAVLAGRWAFRPYVFALRLAGRVPLGEHTIVPQPPRSGAEVWHDAGHSDLVHVWDHRIELTDVHGMTRYTDLVEVRAGVLTPVAWAFAQVFYRHRQRRLNRLVAAGLLERAQN
ncbi:hypothetical protein [Microlunatus flavus]|uniref:Ligand-binding SRPBCC domain-containing protein n=1 Tax=Microlunatus flavus TaxID=1036181 RepID=A0A1H9AZA2_9ACTN|nr:hypothetical protein [Microlunatus flavus]SEP82086.1 hypothetical protein SAMN05421756_101786 [Microlunatus flavus]